MELRKGISHRSLSYLFKKRVILPFSVITCTIPIKRNRMTDQNKKLTAFFISDGTGITVEMLGHSLIAQFDHVIPEKITIPFVDTNQSAREAVNRINSARNRDGHRPIILSTIVNSEIAGILQKADALYLDCFQIYIKQIENELEVNASHISGRSHTVQNTDYSKGWMQLTTLCFVMTDKDQNTLIMLM